MKLTMMVIAVLAVFSLSSFKGEKTEDKASAKATVSITGTITDNASGETLVGVLVALEGTDQKTYTDFDGNFTFDNIKEGTYTLSADIVSYNKIENQKITVKSNCANKTDVKMKSKN